MPAQESKCKHSDVCHRPAEFVEGYCILHLPKGDKSVQRFESAFRDYVATGQSDFSFIVFPSQSTGVLQTTEFPEKAVFRQTVVPGVLNLSQRVFPKGLLVEDTETASINLGGATVEGAVSIRVQRLRNGISANGATFHDDVSFDVLECGGVSLSATFCRTLKLRGRFGDCQFDRAKVHSVLDLEDCTFRNLTFHLTEFLNSSEVKLSRAVLHGIGLKFIGSPSAPAVVCLDGAQIDGDSVLKAELPHPRIRITAPGERVRFEGTVSFTNVDLKKCRIVGNNLTNMEFADVRWEERHGRNILYDEIAMRQGDSISCNRIKEAYQVLKLWYQQKVGDNVIAGDFHYGEMEMKRRGFPWWKKVWSWEFGYWLLSGYGMRPGRPFFWLVVLVFFPALFYWLGNQVTFTQGLSHYLLFSLQVAALQRPPTPASFTEGVRFVQTIQMILSPILIALFALAVRMRVKR